MKKTLIIIFSVFVITGIGRTQEEFSLGSPYSAIGLGEIKYSSSLRTDQMGIQGISLFGNYVNSTNPAANTRLKNVYFSLGMKTEFLESSNNTSSEKISNANVTGFNFGVPFWDKHGLTLIFGFNPYTLMQYKTSGKVEEQGATYTATFAGMGGLTRLNFGLAGRPIDFLNLGFEYDYSFGNIKNLTYFDFNNQNFTNSYIRSENDLKGGFFKGGVVLDFGALLRKSKVFENLSIGFFYQSKFKLKSTIDKIYITSLSNYDSSFTSETEWDVPEAYGFGITKQIGRQLILSSDVSFQKFSGFKPVNLTPAEYSDNMRLGFGFEVLPAPKKDRTVFERLTYRAGFSYDNSYYKIAGQTIDHYAVSFGIGIPINEVNGIDLGFELGTRGKKDNSLVKDNYIKASIGLNFGEFWFIRPSDEDR